MTNLHYLLIGLGVLLVVGVMGYNHLQERRLRKQIDGMFRRSLDTALDDGAKQPSEVFGEAGSVIPEAAVEPLDSLGNVVEESQDTYDDMLNLMRRASLDRDDESDGPLLPDDPTREEVAPEARRPGAASVRPEVASAHARAPMPGTAANEAREAVKHPLVKDVSAAPKQGLAETMPDEPDTDGLPVGAAAPDAPSPVDPEIECVARLRAGQRGVRHTDLLDSLRRAGKPLRCFGLDPVHGWEPANPIRSGGYPVLDIGVQLVDRKGPLNKDQLEALCDILYTYAAEHGGAVTCPNLDAALDKARELDEFCVAVDMLIGINVVAPEGIPFMGRRVDELARAAGMILNGRGGYVLQDGTGNVLFSLANQQGERFDPADSMLTTPVVTLLFDVPNVADGLGVFDRMTAFGFELARALDGRLTDDHGHAVTQASLDNDRRQLAGFYARMQARGIPAGGERARRLFA